MDLAAQERAYREHDRTSGELEAHRGDDAGNAAVFDPEVGDFGLEQRQVRLVLDDRADRLLVERAIGLRARRTDGRALARIERAELDAGTVDRACHRTAERIDLADEVPLADAADRRVAAHLPQGLDALRDEQRACTASCRGERGLGAGMAATHHDHVEMLGEARHRRTSGGRCRARHRHPRTRRAAISRNAGPAARNGSASNRGDATRAGSRQTFMRPRFHWRSTWKYSCSSSSGSGEELLDRTPQVDRVAASRGRGVPVQLREPGMLDEHDVVDRVAEDIGRAPRAIRRACGRRVRIAVRPGLRAPRPCGCDASGWPLWL